MDNVERIETTTDNKITSEGVQTDPTRDHTATMLTGDHAGVSYLLPVADGDPNSDNYSSGNVGVEGGFVYPHRDYMEEQRQVFGSNNGKTLLVASTSHGGPSPTPMMMGTPPPPLMHQAGYYAGIHINPNMPHRDMYAVPAPVLPVDPDRNAGSESPRATEDGEGTNEESSSSNGELIDGVSDRESSDYSGPVKLFVGQVPKTYEETDLFPFFSKYGVMENVTIIRDKHTGQHRGCAFVTFTSQDHAEACEQEMHNQFTFPGGKRPVQIRPASRNESGNRGQVDSENKLFVGMLPRSIAETTIRELFDPYGDITGVYLIRRNDGIKKGCAFVKYAQRESAIAAIEALNEKMTLEGVQRPLIVKFADTKSQKRARQLHATMRDSPYGAAAVSMHGPGHLAQNGAPYYMQPGPPHPIPVYPGHPTPPMGITTAQYPSHQQAQYHAPAHTSYPHTAQAAAPHPHPNFMYQQMGPYGMHAGPDAFSGQPAMGDIPKQRYNRSPRPPQNRYPHNTQHNMPDVVNPRPQEGPAGANLFIYHLPHDLTDADLATAFNPFGNVISAKVYVDKYTGESKGFGFVSYDSVISAEHAIEQMNGFQIGSKRLKVQHKRVHHRPPMMPIYPSGALYPQHQIYNGGIPPSIEVSSEGEETAPGNTTSSQSTQSHDVDGMTTNFASLKTTDERVTVSLNENSD